MSKLRSQLNNLTAGPPSTGETSPNQHNANRSQVQKNNQFDNHRKLSDIKLAIRDLVAKSVAAEKNDKAQVQQNPFDAMANKWAAQEIDPDAIAGSVARSVREDIREQMASEIDRMRQELGTLQQSANESSDKAMLDDIQRISAGIQELQSHQNNSSDQFGEMAGKLSGIHRDIRSIAESRPPEIDHQEISDAIQAAYNEIAKKLDRLGSSQTGDHIVSLSEKLESVKETLSSTDPKTLLRIEDQLAALGEGISALADNRVVENGLASSAELFDETFAGYFEGLERRLDEITRAVVASGPGENGPSDGEAFERIEARIKSLTKSVDSLSQDAAQPSDNPRMNELMQMPDQLQSILLTLEERVGHLSASPANDLPQVNENFGRQLTALVDKIDQMQTVSANLDSSGPMAADLNAKLDTLSLTLERAVNSGDGSVGQLEVQISELSRRFDDAVNADHAGRQHRQENESRIVEELQTIMARVESIDPAKASPQSHNAQLAALEDQMASIAAQLQSIGGKPELSAIENRLEGIEEKFAANREVAIEAARQAIQQSTSLNGGENQASVISSLVEEMKSLTRKSSEIQGHSFETFDAVRDSLSMILDRINSIEMRIIDDEPVLSKFSLQPSSHEEHRRDLNNGQTGDATREYSSSLTQQHEAEQYHENPGYSEPVAAQDVALAEENGLPMVEAPSLDLQNLPEIEDSDESVPRDDLPLEPGSGAPDMSKNGPDMDALMRQAKENKRKTTLEDEQQNPTDFIAAARRAAQAAANEAKNSEESSQEYGQAEKNSSTKGFFARKKNLMMLATAIIILAALAVPVSKMLRTGKSDQGQQVSQTTQSELPQQIASATDKGVDNQEYAQNSDLANNRTDIEANSRQAENNPEQNSPLNDPANLASNERVVREVRDQRSSTLQSSSVDKPVDQANTLADQTAGDQADVAPMPAQVVGPIALRQAAASGDPKALFEVGRRYTAGINNVPDFAEAIKWYELAAKQNHAPAQYRLGNFNEKGHGIPRDVNKAAEWYGRAADQGNALAMHNLAVINAMGVLEGGADMKKASSWFKKAAEYGIKDSQVNLGIVYAKAMGVDADLTKAYKWFAIAAKGGDKDAAQKRDTVAKQLSAAQLEQARGEVGLWKAQKLNKQANSVDIPAEWTSTPDVTASLNAGNMIQKTQIILTKLGFNPGTADGLIGDKTIRAIKQFQAQAGIEVTGKVSPDLINALEKAGS